jgi:hypothetical protein
MNGKGGSGQTYANNLIEKTRSHPNVGIVSLSRLIQSDSLTPRLLIRPLIKSHTFSSVLIHEIEAPWSRFFQNKPMSHRHVRQTVVH